MPQVCIWGWDPTLPDWRKIAVDSTGKVLVYDESQWIARNSMLETWQDEGGIDPVLWTVVDPVGGVAWARGTVGTRLAAASTPNANETARLRSNQPWLVYPATIGVTTLFKRLRLSFELQLTNVANIDNAQTILGGLTAGGLATRASNDILGFGLVGDALQTFTNNGGVETVNTGFGETLTNWNKLGIDITVGSVAFYLNEALVATHITNLPNIPMYSNFHLDTEAGGAAAIRIGPVAVLMEVKLW